MEPRYPRGSHVLVYKTKRVHKGDVIAFRLSAEALAKAGLKNNPKKVLVKRIKSQAGDDFQVAGDNPDDSLDVGPVCRDEIIGRVVLYY